MAEDVKSRLNPAIVVFSMNKMIMDRSGKSLAVLTAVCAAVLFHGCSGNRIQKAAETAENFAKAYYSADYGTAAQLCSAELEEMVLGTGAVIDSLPAAAQAEFMELSSGVQTYMGDVHAWTKDSVTVDFDILYPGEMEPIRTALTVVRNPEEDSWLVVYAQERM